MKVIEIGFADETIHSLVCCCICRSNELYTSFVSIYIAIYIATGIVHILALDCCHY